MLEPSKAGATPLQEELIESCCCLEGGFENQGAAPRSGLHLRLLLQRGPHDIVSGTS